MKTISWILLLTISSIVLFSEITKAEKPINRIFIITKNGKMIEFQKKPEVQETESAITPSLEDRKIAEPIEQKIPCFNITDFIKPESEIINDLEIDLNDILHKIEASEAQTK